MAIETELKFRVPAQKLKALVRPRIAGSRSGEPSEGDLVSTYFDTAKRKLKRRGFTLRIRQDGGRHVQTIKSAGGVGFGRGEWESELEDSEPDLGKAEGTPLDAFASRKLRHELKPIFETSVRRITVPLRTKQSEIELAIDRGHTTAGHRSRPIEEIELELKSGLPLDLFRLARALERKVGAELDLRSKSDHGYELAGDDEHFVVSAESIVLDPEFTAGEAFRVIARSTFRHFSLNADAVREGEPEGIHQMRVGLRRLRAAISLFSKILAGPSTEEAKGQLKWLTNELAPARELDVFVKQEIEPASHDALLRRGGKAIRQEFSRRRDRAFARARTAVNSTHYRVMLIDTLQWIEARQTIAAEDEGGPIGKFAAALLHRRIRKLRKDGRRLNGMSAGERHKVRIRTKKIRYAIDFFESLFSGKREQRQLARQSKHLKRIQDALGSLNDFAAHRKLAVDAALKAPHRKERVRAFASGVVLGREEQAAKPLIMAAAKEVRGLAKF
ncbi:MULTISPECIES: CYTH and CHAD domain-containing protein [unclassified Bradyrhizobium]|uniref:CYTH and CHAD domain-containing protein n=1 Tax=unclassified Bradyrhizobium TaxID=2631580 RepID=UPI002478F85F|nr:MULTISPECIES: CYTH and CHAD domain-containing protein [unclassified Bradyrhizobium]WGS19629.1 CHAD domain-containing protein [Bradyrhizobium sp. ISRA463]WGS26473.1 CHAD domain-containing protein [Bradyrhizobium sp. ISRA464]